MVQSIEIVLVCMTSTIAYGILHDQITARVCVESFTIGHPPVFGTDDPTLFGIGWGIIATWWMGLIPGVPLAIAARAGSRPKRSVGSLLRPIDRLLLVMAVCALAAGCVGGLLAEAGAVRLVGPIAEQVSRDRHTRFLADLWAHRMSYGIGFFGSLVVMGRVWRLRRATGETDLS